MRKVLIVNCSPERAEHLRKILAERRDLSVIAHVFNGNDALSIAKEIRPSLVFTCISLQGISGLDLAKRLMFEFPEIRVVIGTAHSDAEEKAISSGADAFIQYPARAEEILDAIDRALSVRQ